MPRIRTIKPEFCTSEQIGECSTSARLLFATMWCFCDDAGRHSASPLRLKAECFPFDSFTKEQMVEMVDELLAVGLLIEYEHDGQRFWQVTGWKHQKIERPTYKYGPFDESGKPLEIDERSTSTRRHIAEPSPPEGNGKESKGKEGNGKEGSGIDDKSPKPTARPTVEQVREYMGEQGYPDEAEAFHDHYTANGWVQGRGKPIKDWKASVRNWQRNDFGKSKKPELSREELFSG